MRCLDRIGERIVGRVAGRVAGVLHRARGGAAALRGRRLGHHGAGQGLGSLRTAERTATGADIDLVQYLGRLPKLGHHLHHDVVLVLRLVDHRYLALPKGVVERVVDLAGGEPETRRGGPVDDQIGLEPILLLVEIDVAQQRQIFERRCDLGRPFVELVSVFAKQGILVS
jgi:hypothetical protein